MLDIQAVIYIQKRIIKMCTHSKVLLKVQTNKDLTLAGPCIII